MSLQIALTCFVLVLSDVWALQEPPIYYDRNNILQDKIPHHHHSACWEKGGVCTPLANCPTRPILNLAVLGDLCGDASGVSVCCKYPAPIEEEVFQVAACNEKKAFCTWDNLCPLQSRVTGPQLCGGQEGVSCCSTSQERKRAFGPPGFFAAPAITRPSPKKSFIKLRASGVMNTSPDQLAAGGAGRTASKFTVDAVSIAKKNARAQQNEDNSGVPSNAVDSTSAGPLVGPAERHRGHAVTEENCFQKGGLCVQREHCPLEDQLGPHDLCGFQNFVACCKASSLTKPEP